MSYARFGNGSDVYVYLDVAGHLSCCACSLSDDWQHYSTDAMVSHLAEHEAVGHAVPDFTIPALKAERVENDAYIASKAAGT